MRIPTIVVALGVAAAAAVPGVALAHTSSAVTPEATSPSRRVLQDTGPWMGFGNGAMHDRMESWMDSPDGCRGEGPGSGASA